jgi:hypothetical protein
MGERTVALEPVGDKDNSVVGERTLVASPLVVFERGEVSSVAGSLLLGRAGGTATAGPQGPL